MLVHRQVLTGALSVPIEGRLVRLHPVDLARNARDRRGPRTVPASAMPHLEEAKTALVDRIERRMSVAVIAPAGAGKTCLLRAVRHQLPEARYRVHYVKVTELSKRDLCREIATAVGVTPAGTYPMLVRRLQEDFEQLARTDGIRPVLVLDDAHDIRPEVLGILRVLRTNCAHRLG